MMRRLIFRFLRVKVIPADIKSLALVPDSPYCYVLESDAYTSRLILDVETEKLGMPRALAPLTEIGARRRTHVIAMQRWRGFLIRRPVTRTHSPGLARLVHAVATGVVPDVQLIPANILIGRSPTKDWGFFRLFFSENWELAGRTRTFFKILFNGRATQLQLSRAISIRQILDEGLDEDRAIRKLSRLLRKRLRDVKSAAIGPDLSHRRTITKSILATESVRLAISAHAEKHAVSENRARKRAEKMLLEIAAHYSYSVVRILARALTWFWNKIYSGVQVSHMDKFLEIAPGNEVVYVPCHRSHIDYLLLSYLLYSNGIVPPHIAAGVNLNLPIVGPILRRGGAFFLRRSFKNNRLYSAVFHEYVNHIFAKGASVEYFIEGSRSRTGRLLQPKPGMLSMTVRNYIAQPRRPVVFQPVYIGYEKLIEGGSYTHELSGKKKRSESLLGVFKSLKVIRQNFGKVHVGFGEPIFLAEHLDRYNPDWRKMPESAESKPTWLQESVTALANRIMTHINLSADVNPVNLMALVLLATPKKAMGEEALAQQLDLTSALIRFLPQASDISLTEKTGQEIVAYALGLSIVERVSHPLGDVIRATEAQATLLTYFRNNILHLFALPSWIALCFLRNREFSRTRILRLGKMLYPYVRAELFLHWDHDGYEQAMLTVLDAFVRLGLLQTKGQRTYVRAEGGSDRGMQLSIFSHSMRQMLERYYISIAVIVQHGQGALTTAELVCHCHETAQRLALVQEFNAPEYFDKSLFKQFVATLKQESAIWTNDVGKLEYDQRIDQVYEEAKVILSKQLRHGILHATPGSVGG